MTEEWYETDRAYHCPNCQSKMTRRKIYSGDAIMTMEHIWHCESCHTRWWFRLDGFVPLAPAISYKDPEIEDAE